MQSLTRHTDFYVVSLADHAAGYHHGAWVSVYADTTVDALQRQVDTMLASSPAVAAGAVEAAGEIAVHDCNQHGITVPERMPLVDLARLGRYLAQHGDEFAAFYTIVAEEDLDDAEELFRFSRGACWSSVAEWAWATLLQRHPDAYRAVNQVDGLRFDPEQFAEAARVDGYHFVELRPGWLWVFPPLA